MSAERDVQTSVGLGRVAWDAPRRPHSILVLGHGAGGGVDARDLIIVRDAALAAGHAVARVTQPYRVAGRRAPAPAPTLDTAFGELVKDVVGRRRTPVVVGGRSSGARVACRTAAGIGAVGVLALAFPLHPPGRPERSRAEELRGVTVPTLVVQGDRDAFGSPSEVRTPPLPANIEVFELAGANHGFAVRKGDPPIREALSTTVVKWLDQLVG